MKNQNLLLPLSTLAIMANLLFFMWILYNGINENFAGTTPEKVSYITLMLLLLVNSLLLWASYLKRKTA